MENKEMTNNNMGEVVTDNNVAVKDEYVKGFDFGRSGIRKIDKNGDIMLYDSSFIEIKADAKVRVEGGNPKDDFTVIECPWSNINGKRFVKGTTMDFHEGLVRKADETEFKTYQDETYINAIYSIAVDIYDRIDNFVAEAENDVNGLVGEFKGKTVIGLCMPVKEFFTGDHKDVIKENLAGEYIVRFNILGKTVKFSIDKNNILVSPEGMVAWLLLTTHKDKSVLALIAKTNGVIIDVGHGSTDITIVRNGSPYGKKAASAPFGGVNFESLVADKLESARKINTPGSIRRAIEEGVVSDGTLVTGAGKEVREAKEDLADEIVRRVKNVLKTAMMNSKEISYLYFVGRSFIVVGEENKGDKVDGENTVNKPIDNYTGSLADMVVSRWGSPVTNLRVPRADELKEGTIVDIQPKDDEDFNVEAFNEEVANVRGLRLGLLKK